LLDFFLDFRLVSLDALDPVAEVGPRLRRPQACAGDVQELGFQQSEVGVDVLDLGVERRRFLVALGDLQVCFPQFRLAALSSVMALVISSADGVLSPGTTHKRTVTSRFMARLRNGAASRIICLGRWSLGGFRRRLIDPNPTGCGDRIQPAN